MNEDQKDDQTEERTYNFTPTLLSIPAPLVDILFPFDRQEFLRKLAKEGNGVIL